MIALLKDLTHLIEHLQGLRISHTLLQIICQNHQGFKGLPYGLIQNLAPLLIIRYSKLKAGGKALHAEETSLNTTRIGLLQKLHN